MNMKDTMPNNYESIALATSKEVLDDDNEFMFKVLNEANRWAESETALLVANFSTNLPAALVHDAWTSGRTKLSKTLCRSFLQRKMRTQTRWAH